MIYLGADHRGFKLKEEIKNYLTRREVDFEDLGPLVFDIDDDYVDFASAGAEKVRQNPGHKGIFICGSGHGMDMVANKYPGIRAALVFNRQVAAQSREHEDANVLILPSDWLASSEAIDIVTVWLGKQFSGEERHVRRLGKIGEIERENFK